MRLPILNVAWHRYMATALLVSGLWLELLFLVMLFPNGINSPPYRGTGLEAVALFMFMSAGVAFIVLSYFIFRRHNWARVVVVLWCVAAALVTTALLVTKVIAGSIHSADEIGELLVAAWFLLFPASIALFLVNKSVVDEFTSDSPPGKKAGTNAV